VCTGFGVGPCPMTQQTSEDVAECLRRAAEAEACAEATNNAKFKAEYQRIAQTWRTLARGYEFEGSLGRFISFNESRKKTTWKGSAWSRKGSVLQARRSSFCERYLRTR
jgi:hypothetical protein